MSALRPRYVVWGLLLVAALAAWCSPPLATAEAPDSAVQPFIGTYTYAGGDAQIKALDQAIDEVVDQMNFLIRGIARRRLRTPNLPSKEVSVFVENGQIRIERPGQPEVSAPEDGRPITWRHPRDGDVFQVSHGIDDQGVLYQRFEGERSVSLNRFVLSEDQERLTIHTVITADRLPAPLRFKMTYERRTGPESQRSLKGGLSMSLAKIVEISSESTASFEDAINEGIQTASKTVQNIKGAWVKEQQVVVEDGKVVSYRVDLKITFVLDAHAGIQL